MLSQNGWYASRDTREIHVGPFIVAGVAFPNGVRTGDVDTVLRYLAEEFHRTVEPLRIGECWGYFYKPIEGSVTLSNHASGTAIDINAPRHPMGKRGTFTAKQVDAIRTILTFLGGVIRWGGDYIGRPDEMHFEINANSTAVAKIATKIRLVWKVRKMDADITTMIADTNSRMNWTDGRIEAISQGYDNVRSIFKGAGNPVWIVREMKEQSNRLSAIESLLIEMKAKLDTL